MTAKPLTLEDDGRLRKLATDIRLVRIATIPHVQPSSDRETDADRLFDQVRFNVRKLLTTPNVTNDTDTQQDAEQKVDIYAEDLLLLMKSSSAIRQKQALEANLRTLAEHVRKDNNATQDMKILADSIVQQRSTFEFWIEDIVPVITVTLTGTIILLMLARIATK